MDDAFLKEVLECSVCLEQLTLNSKVLPCQHTFCRRCLEEIVASKGQLLCPECRLPVDRPIAELPNNILLARLLEGMRQKRNAVALEERRRQADLELASATQVPLPDELTIVHRDVRRSLDHGRPDAAITGLLGDAGEMVVPVAPVTDDDGVEKFPAKALALYSFSGPEKDDLKFSKGDLLTLISRVDANWYWAERSTAAGLVPANYVQTLCMEKTVPGIALFDFQKDNPSRQYLKFNRGERVEFLHKMDDNWAFGKCGDNIGLYPLSYVQMPLGTRRPVPSCKSQHRHRHSVPIMILSDSALTSDCSPRHRGDREATPGLNCSSATQTPGLQAPSSPRKYVALYNYWPKGKDELELFRGHLYTVQDKCPDGWFRGCCVSTGKTGLFPGNYVRPKSNAETDLSPPSPGRLPPGALAPTPSPVMLVAPVGAPSRLKFTSPPSSSPDRQPGAMSQSVPAPARQREAGLLSCRCRTGAAPDQPGQTGASLVEALTSGPLPGAGGGEVGGGVGLPRRLSADVLELASFTAASGDRGHAGGGGGGGEGKHHHGKAHNWERKSSCGRKAFIGSGTSLFSRLARLSSGGSNSGSSNSVSGSSSSRQHAAQHASSSSSSGGGAGVPPSVVPTNSGDHLHHHHHHHHLITSTTSNSSSSSGTSSPARHRQVYRCIIPYPADSVQELELDTGDLILLKERRADGWLYGQLQRSGKMGLFPSSFVELYSGNKTSLPTS